MKMFFSRAGAATLWESKCRPCREAATAPSPHLSYCLPWGQGALPVLAARGRGAVPLPWILRSGNIYSANFQSEPLSSRMLTGGGGGIPPRPGVWESESERLWSAGAGVFVPTCCSIIWDFASQPLNASTIKN